MASTEQLPHASGSAGAPAVDGRLSGGSDEGRPLDLADLEPVGLAAGLDAVGVTSAEPLEPARSILPRRRAAGLAGAMQFTYRNPERSTDPTRFVAGARSLIVGVLGYRTALPPAPDGVAGRVARYAWSDHYGRLREGLEAMAEVLRAEGHTARVVADSNALVDRNAAWRAGLGWYGKNTNLLIPGGGSWYVLGAVVTDAEVTGGADQPAADECGPCRACIDDCPTDAIVAPGVLDARRCIAWLVQAAEPIPVEFRAAVGDRLYGCDICQEVCPPNRLEDRRDGPAPVAEGDAWADVLWVLEADDDALLSRYGRWYLADRNPDVLRRTALVIVGNTARADQPQVAALLARYVASPSPVLRAHAVWAARMLGLDALAARCADDPDPTVRAEVTMPLAAATSTEGGA